MSVKNIKKKIIKKELDDDISENTNESEELSEEIDNLEDEYNNIIEIEGTETFTECIIDKLIEDEQDDFDNELDYFDNNKLDEFDNNKIHNFEEKLLKGKDRISANRLTKYEMVRILGERTKQLTMGAKPLIKNYEGLNYYKIAEEELKLNMIPYKIKRPLPNGKYEIWTLDELYKDHLLNLLE
jgi:DNA-directed RNA polymerase subunit K/omega